MNETGISMRLKGNFRRVWKATKSIIIDQRHIINATKGNTITRFQVDIQNSDAVFVLRGDLNKSKESETETERV